MVLEEDTLAQAADVKVSGSRTLRAVEEGVQSLVGCFQRKGFDRRMGLVFVQLDAQTYDQV